MQPNAHRCPYKKIGVAKDIIDNLKQRQLEQSNIYNNLLKKYHECSLIINRYRSIGQQIHSIIYPFIENSAVTDYITYYYIIVDYWKIKSG